jgi:quercetin dioxygenase-like cupin family protein
MNVIACDFSRGRGRAKAAPCDRPAAAACGQPAYHTTLSALDTRGPLSLVDSTWPAGTRIARHVHPDEDELVVVLSGEIELCVGGLTVRRGPGTSVFIPRGVEHGARAVTEARHVAILSRECLSAPPTAPAS